MLKKLFRFGLAVSASSIVTLPLSVNAQLVPGTTNDGGKLFLVGAMLSDPPLRHFSYMYTKNRVARYNRAKTQWCRNGQIEKDNRPNRLTSIEKQISKSARKFLSM